MNSIHIFQQKKGDRFVALKYFTYNNKCKLIINSSIFLGSIENSFESDGHASFSRLHSLCFAHHKLIPVLKYREKSSLTTGQNRPVGGTTNGKSILREQHLDC